MSRRSAQDQAIRITESTQRDILDYLWANNQRLIYLMDRNGDENFRAYAVNRDGSDFKELTPFENVQVRVIDELEEAQTKS